MQQFKETQRFNQWWLRILFLAILIVALSPLFAQKIGPGSNIELVSVLISVVIITSIFLAIYFLFKLDTIIGPGGIQYKFFPFHIKYRKIPWQRVRDIKVITYNPIRDYGGWGYRLTLRKKRALSVKGKIGIQIAFR